VRLPEKCLEWQMGAWKFGVILCPGIWRVSIWLDGNPYNLTITLPLTHIWFERDGGNHWPWEWTILRIVIGKQEIRTDLTLNYWGLGVVVHQTDDWSIHLGPLDIECEHDKFYDLDDDWIRPADLRLFSKVREPCECERESQEIRRATEP
jgi:hypothetical protein